MPHHTKTGEHRAYMNIPSPHSRRSAGRSIRRNGLGPQIGHRRRTVVLIVQYTVLRYSVVGGVVRRVRAHTMKDEQRPRPVE